MKSVAYDSGTMRPHKDDITAGMASIKPSSIMDGFSVRNNCMIETANNIPSQHVTAKHSPSFTLLGIYLFIGNDKNA